MTNTFTPGRRLRAGDWVQVRSKEEILSTLDANGRLDELPFMPEMLQYCGMKMQVGKRAHKTCDPAVGIGGRKMTNTVHLENIRCNGSAHDGCQAACLIFWKEAWLKRVDGEPARTAESLRRMEGMSSASNLPRMLSDRASKIPPAPGESEPTYVCQNTQIKFATQPLKSWDLRQYVEDYTSGNVSLSQLAAGLAVHLLANGLGSRGGVRYANALDLMTGSSVPSAVVHIRCGHSACPKARRRRKRNWICSKANLFASSRSAKSSRHWTSTIGIADCILIPTWSHLPSANTK